MKEQIRQCRLLYHQLSCALKRSDLGFSTTEEISPYSGLIGQKRALQALKFSVEMDGFGYHTIVTGNPSSGRTYGVFQFLNEHAKNLPAAMDLAYVDNFDQPSEPILLQISAGSGPEFIRDILRLIDNLLATFPDCFEYPNYQRQKNNIDVELNQSSDKMIEGVEKEALIQDILLYQDSSSITFTPSKDGIPIEDEDYNRLSNEEKEIFQEKIDHLEIKLNEALISLPQLKREAAEKLRRLNERTIASGTLPLFKSLRGKYRNNKSILNYLQSMQEHLQLTIIEYFYDTTENAPHQAVALRNRFTNIYRPNLIVTQTSNIAPVIFESNPDYKNLFGSIESSISDTDKPSHHHKIHSGSMHKANGGFLIIELDKLINDSESWSALKRNLKNQCLRLDPPISDVNNGFKWFLQPEPLPLTVKVILIGSRDLYYFLQQIDPDFGKLFRVMADFDDNCELTPKSLNTFSQMLRYHTDQRKYPPITANAILALIEHSCRLAEHQKKFSANFGATLETIDEANHIRHTQGLRFIEQSHIEDALQQHLFRNSRIKNNLLVNIETNTVMIETHGLSLGRCNALVVFSLGNMDFGTPNRVSATASPGNQGVIDIERESQLGQAIHTKGMMILSGYLRFKYADTFAISMSASIALEQSYSLVDGDSAALAELSALLSALSGVKIKQSLAMSGSINQYGEVQAVGGINDKIEGFYQLCCNRGLSGQQGVIIPAGNKENLVLKRDLRESVKNNEFHIYAVKNVDQALEILTEHTAGASDSQNNYPPDSINDRVKQRLKAFSKIATVTKQ